MNNSCLKVNFFIVGAPKCGTTALFKYLGMHPNIFVPNFIIGNEGKMETNHFAPEFTGEKSPFRNRTYYLSFYQNALAGQILGDASVYHLYSRSAPVSLYKFNPEARIIIMIRNPVDFIYSYYQEMKFIGLETSLTLEQALAAEPDRLDGKNRLNDKQSNPEYLCYRKLAHFSAPIQRYLDVFPREQIMFIKFDDFINDTKRIYGMVLDFLGANKWYPDKFQRVNPSKQIRSVWLRKALLSRPQPVVAVLKWMLGKNVRASIRRRLLKLERRLNTKPCRQEKDPALIQKLQREFQSEITALSQMTGLDLKSWM